MEEVEGFEKRKQKGTESTKNQIRVYGEEEKP